MTYLVEVPIDGGGRMVVEAAPDTLPGELELAALRPGEIVMQVGQSLESALDAIKPSLAALRDALIATAPREVTIEFGLAIGGETGIVVARGTSKVHFAVTMTWDADR